MSVVDLAIFRATRAAAEAEARQIAQALAGGLTDLARAEAERAFRVSGPIAANNLTMAQDINRNTLRRLKANLRRQFGPNLCHEVIEHAEVVYTDRLRTLIAERDARRGGTL